MAVSAAQAIQEPTAATSVSSAYLLHLLAALPHPVAIFDTGLHCVHLNEAFARLSPPGSDIRVGHAVDQLLLRMSAQLAALVRQCLNNGTAITDQAIDIPHADERARHWRLAIAPCKATTPEGEVAAVIVQLHPLQIDHETHKALRAAEAQARRVLDNLFTFVGLLTPDGTVIDANRAPLEAGGLTLEEVRGRKLWDTYWFSHDPQLQARLQASTDAAAQGKPARYDITVRMKDDTRMPIEFMLAPLRNDDGVITHLVPSAIDISSRTHSAEALRQSEERFRCVVEAAPDGLAMVDRNGRLALVNSGMERMFGYPREELLGQPIEMLIPERYRKGHPGLRGAYMNAPTTRDMAGRRELYALRKDGSEFPVEIGLNALSTVGGEHVLAAIVDVTKRKADEEALRRSEERFRCVVEAAPDGLAMVDRDGHLALVNSGMERLFGYPREELLGQPIEMLMPERYRNAHHGLRSAYMTAPTTRDMAGRRELYARRRDGSEFPVEIGLNALNTVGGEHVLAAIVDMTRRKADQAIIQTALDEKTVLLNEVHHRVKNNLQVVCSLLSLQARTASEDARGMLEDSQRRVKAMALIHQLLYERSDFSTVDLSLYLRRLVSLMHEVLGEARARVRLQVDTSAADIHMDLQRSVPCGLLVNELLTNAIKHGFPDGRSGEILLTTELLGPDQARIVISDNGVGIPPDITPGDVSKSLGFQLIPLFVDQLGGELRLIRDQGSRFELYFKPGLGRD
ncbi:PAS domain S-box protein [Uliginosibacterium sp. H3]|uniref:PAS domain S-box protein n=1 Tax=Uliginosibacterium silvisoli TaxID=3114758 RepID=A0ABU6K3Y0_9RHOO|nr:PAS domain S-box protein [Uliginosibacterium sp. H3]